MSADRPRWTPQPQDTSTVDRCKNCGTQVTRAYVRVFGDSEDTLHACHDCMGKTAVKRGAGSDPDFERRIVL